MACSESRSVLWSVREYLCAAMRSFVFLSPNTVAGEEHSGLVYVNIFVWGCPPLYSSVQTQSLAQSTAAWSSRTFHQMGKV